MPLSKSKTYDLKEFQGEPGGKTSAGIPMKYRVATDNSGFSSPSLVLPELEIDPSGTSYILCLMLYF